MVARPLGGWLWRRDWQAEAATHTRPKAAGLVGGAEDRGLEEEIQQAVGRRTERKRSGRGGLKIMKGLAVEAPDGLRLAQRRGVK
jgi:hypothetical protein